jgi:hypothetical protein
MSMLSPAEEAHARRFTDALAARFDEEEFERLATGVDNRKSHEWFPHNMARTARLELRMRRLDDRERTALETLRLQEALRIARECFPEVWEATALEEATSNV